MAYNIKSDGMVEQYERKYLVVEYWKRADNDEMIFDRQEIPELGMIRLGHGGEWRFK